MRGYSSLAAATLIAGNGIDVLGPAVRMVYPHGRAPSVVRRPYSVAKPPTNGKREVARRLRQIQDGQLQAVA